MTNVINLSGITKTYKLGDEILNALDNVDLKVQQEEFLAITGPIGSRNILAMPLWLILSIIIGTTLVGMIAGLYPARRALNLTQLKHYILNKLK